MSLWNNWLYRRLLLLMAPHYWSVGVLDFCAGREAPRNLGNGTIECYTIFGQGIHEQGTTDFTPFEPGTVLKFKANQFHTFACDKPTRLLVLASEAPLDFNLSTTRLAPGRDIAGSATTHYVLAGSVDVHVGADYQKIDPATAFSMQPKIEYTLNNAGKQDALILNISAQVVAKREINGEAFA